MAKRKKSVATRLDEVDRTMYSTFCSAANSLSLLYTQAMNQQKVTFQAGERHALEKVYSWILTQHEAGTRLTVSEIVAHLQSELDYSGEDSWQTTATAQHGPRGGQLEQPKSPVVFSNALSSPVRRSLQPYHLGQNSTFGPNPVHGPRAHDSGREPDATMDMHSDPEP